MRRLLMPAVGAALVLAGGCVTESRDAGTNAADAAARNDWQTRGGARSAEANPLAAVAGGKDIGADDVFDAPPPRPEDVVQVPREVYAPIDSFFDHEGYLLGDRVEVDCSFEPFKARMAGLAFADGAGKFVARTESREGGVHEVRLLNLDQGPQVQASRLPRATFGTLTALREADPSTGGPGKANLRPFFEIVATREIRIRFHSQSSRENPVFFRARALGTPGALDPTAPRECVYVNANRRRRVRGPELLLSLEILRGADGRWRPEIREPEEAPPR